jgi:hypothetical protein
MREARCQGRRKAGPWPRDCPDKFIFTGDENQGQEEALGGSGERAGSQEEVIQAPGQEWNNIGERQDPRGGCHQRCRRTNLSWWTPAWARLWVFRMTLKRVVAF